MFLILVCMNGRSMFRKHLQMEICYVSVFRHTCLLRCETLVTVKGAGLNVSHLTLLFAITFKKSYGRSCIFYYFDFPYHFLLIWNNLHGVHVLSISTKMYDLHYIRRFPVSVTIPNDVGQISNYCFYSCMNLNALYIFKFLPVWSVYTINKSRKAPAALDSKGNWLPSFCNRTWGYETFVAVKCPHFSFSVLSLSHRKSFHGLWGEGLNPFTSF